MLCIHISRNRNGALSAVIETTSPAPPYTPPPIVREVIDFGLDESVSEVFQELGEMVAELLEKRAHEACGSAA